MPVYEYKALDGSGRSRTGIIDAESESNARTRIRALGQYPVEIRQSSVRNITDRNGLAAAFVSLQVTSREISLFTRQLATLLGAGIPLVQSLSVLIAQTSNASLKKVIAGIKDSVNEGNSLTNAIAGHPRLFSNVYINMVRAGEASGSLDVVLERLADFSEKQGALKGRLQAALIYPAFMGVVGTGILMFLITSIVPSITKVFTDMKQSLPLPTLLLIGLSNFLMVYWWLVLLLVAAGLFAGHFSLKSGFGRSYWDLVKLKMPITGRIMQKILLARCASTLASLLESSVGLITSLQIVRTLMDNVWIGTVIDEAIEQIRQGKSMGDSLGASPWFPPMFVQMVAVGEQSGNLGPMLRKVAEAYERDVETAILGMTALIEPLMILVMGAGVGFVVLSILLPIFEMNQMVR
jgi:general secretion pathway protein F